MLDTSTAPLFAGRYRLLDELGRGGMGVVHRAEHVELGRVVALKVMLASDEKSRARFLREMRVTARLTHPHIVRIFDIGEHEGTPFFTMELVQGEALSRRLTRGRLGFDEVVTLARQVASALCEAHGLGLVHRDLKPDNLILSEVEGALFVRVLDFGVAHDSHDEAPLTRTGAILGTALYMSPEQARGLSLDGRSDLYALGCILYEALTGRPPCVGKDFVSTLVAHLQTAPTPIRELRPEVPVGLARLVEDLLAKDADERMNNAQEVLARLDALSAPGGLTSTVTVEAAAPRRPRRWPWFVLVGVAILGVVVVAGTGSSEDPAPSPAAPGAMNRAATETLEKAETTDAPLTVEKQELSSAERTEEERQLYNDLSRLTANADWAGAKRRLEGVTIPKTGEFAVPLHYLERMVNENQPR